MDTPPMISTPPAISVGGFRDLVSAYDAMAGVGSFPSGFALDKPPSDQASASALPSVPNLYAQLQQIFKGTPLESDHARLAILLAIGFMHNFGILPDMATNNWLAVPLSPPCDPTIGRVPVPNYVPASCVQTYPSQQQGTNAFVARINEMGFLSFLLNSNGNFTQLAAAIYPITELSGVDPTIPLSTEGFKQFQSFFWTALQKGAIPNLPPDAANQVYNFWYQTDEIPPFGPPGQDTKNLKYLPSEKAQRLYTAAAFLANEWPFAQLPLSNTVEAQTAIQGILAMTYLFGDFGKVGQVETNNWFQVGSPATNNEPCGEMRTLNPLLQRCVWVHDTVQKGAQSALTAILLSPNVKEQLLSGDLGKLAHAVLKDGFFAPTIPTKEIWVEATRILGEAVAEIVAISGDTPRWKTSDFTPTDFVGMVPNPNPCQEDEDLVAGICVKKQRPRGIETKDRPTAESSGGSNLGWWLLGAGLVVGVGGWWWMSSKKNEASPRFQS